MGALELRNGVRNLGDIQLATPDVFAAMSPEMIFDFAGIKLDAGRTGDEPFALGWTVTDADGSPAAFLLEVHNGVLVYTRDASLEGTIARVSSSKAALAAALFDARPLDDLVSSGDASVDGDRAVVDRLFGMLDDFPLWFPIVQP
jgi:alkyl sulfatase BDS1-like metallo-beta-lactamase superfamily hydrolase